MYFTPKNGERVQRESQPCSTLMGCSLRIHSAQHSLCLAFLLSISTSGAALHHLPSTGFTTRDG